MKVTAINPAFTLSQNDNDEDKPIQASPSQIKPLSELDSDSDSANMNPDEFKKGILRLASFIKNQTRNNFQKRDKRSQILAAYKKISQLGSDLKPKFYTKV